MSLSSLLSIEPPGKLSAEESSELATQVAQLAKSGLPLDGGLRALAEEMPNRRSARALRRVAAQPSLGATLDTAILTEGKRLPPHLRGLIVAGVRSGRLPEVLEEFVTVARSQRELRRKAILSIAYPALLLAIMTLLWVFFDTCLLGQFVDVFEGFMSKLPTLTEFVFVAARPITWIMTVLTFAVLGTMLLGSGITLGMWGSRIARLIPIAGTILRWGSLAQLCRVLALLLEQQVPLPQAMRFAAGSLRDRFLAESCCRVANGVETGLPLESCLESNSPQFPPSMTVMIAWGAQSGTLNEAFRASADVFDARARSQSVLLQTILPPLAYLVIVGMASLLIVALLMPLMSLFQNLSK
jgi:type II secretory pathway component PulF